MLRKGFVLATAAAIVTGCGRTANGERNQELSVNGEPLRKAFNKDVDKVRILMLVSPT